jgi:hypothetical protein
LSSGAGKFKVATVDTQVKVLTGTLVWRAQVRTACAAIAVAMLCGSSLAGTGTQADSEDPLAVIVPSMEKAQADIRLPGQVVREYHVSTAKSISSDSAIVAEIDFAPQAHYVIQKRYGSMRAEFVVKNVMQHELEMSVSEQKLQSAAITRRNYDFQFLGNDSLEGHQCYVLQLLPRRGQPELIRGRVWVDQQSFLIRRIEGDLAKSPSWWVKSAHVDIHFSDFRGMWLQTSWNAQADVRCFGAQELSSRVLDYAVVPAMVRNTRRSTPTFAAAATR